VAVPYVNYVHDKMTSGMKWGNAYQHSLENVFIFSLSHHNKTFYDNPGAMTVFQSAEWWLWITQWRVCFWLVWLYCWYCWYHVQKHRVTL